MTELPDKLIAVHGDEHRIEHLPGKRGEEGVVIDPSVPEGKGYVIDTKAVLGYSYWRRLRRERYASVGLVDPLDRDYPVPTDREEPHGA